MHRQIARQRPLLLPREDLGQVFAILQRSMGIVGILRCPPETAVDFKRVTYLVDPGPETSPLGGKRVRVYEWEDGRVEIHAEGRSLPYSIFDENPHVTQGAVVENKRLGADLAIIQAA